MIAGELEFPGGRRATLVDVDPGELDLQAVAAALGLEQPDAIITIAGGAARLDEHLSGTPTRRAALIQLLDQGLAPFAANASALVIDGGTEVGVMALVGRALATRGEGATLVGVAPSGCVRDPGAPAHEAETGTELAELDPNHPHFVLVTGDTWGDETALMYRLADAAIERSFTLVDGAESSGVLRRGPTPALCLVINGGEVAKQEVLCAVRRGWPVVLVAGSGGLADDLAGLDPDDQIDDPILAELIADGRIYCVSLDAEPRELRGTLARLLDPETHEALLIHAWESFARHDTQAIRHQRTFGRLQLLILGLGLVAVTAALMHDWVEGVTERAPQLGAVLPPLRGLIIALPIGLSLLMAVTSRFKQGSKWISMRAAAESIKREIFLFRSHAGPYRRRGHEAFARRLAAVGARTMASPANEASLPPYRGPIPPHGHHAGGRDDGLCELDANRYISFRLGDQLMYYTNKSARLERQLRHLSWLIYLIGAVGTLLAAIGAELWVALTSATAGAIMTYLEYQQTEFNLVKYNQTRAKLEDTRTWWQSLSPAEHNEANFRALVERTEQVLDSEFGGWLQNMQEILELSRDERASGDGAAQGEVAEPARPQANSDIEPTPPP